MSGITKVASTTAPSKPLYSMSFIAGVPTITENEYSTFHTSDGKSISDIRRAAYAPGAKGRFSRVQRVNDYIIKHLIHHYSPDLALHEVRNLIKCIGNPQVVQILGAEIYSSEAFIIYQYIPGQTLHDYIHKTPPPTHSELMRRYAEASNAIQNLHEQGLVHLDINPKNIWVPEDSKKPVILLDLGSMHAIGEERTVITGTPGYYPVFGNLSKADPKLNLYAMSAILTKYPPPIPARPPPLLNVGEAGAMGGAGSGAVASAAAMTEMLAPAKPLNMTNVHELKGGRRRRLTNRKKRISRKRRV